MLPVTSVQPLYHARCRASSFKRLRVEFDGQKDVGAVQRNRRMLIAVPSTFKLVTHLAEHLHERFASDVSLQSPLSLSVDGYALPAAEPLQDLIREDDVLIVRENVGAMRRDDAISTPVAKRCRVADVAQNAATIRQNSCLKEEVNATGLISSAEAVARARKELASRKVAAEVKNDHDSDDTERKAAALKAAKAAALAEASAALELASTSITDRSPQTHVEHSHKKLVTCADKLQEETSNKENCQKEITVETEEPKQRAEESKECSKECRVFVGGLPWACTSDVLRKDFSECGTIVDLKIMEDKETGRSRGFAFITFADEAGLAAALKYDGEEYGGRTLKVSRTDSKGKSKGKGKCKK